MKKNLIIFLCLLAMFMVSCGQEVSTYNKALDSDRGGREKMLTALSQMHEANMFAEEAKEGFENLVAEKQAASKADFEEALKSWDDAKTTYLELIQEFPDNPEYLNNLGNMIYYKVYSGLEGDLKEAKSYLEKAVSKTDKPRYNRNLELIEELESNEETKALVAEHRELVKQIKAVK